MADKRFFYRVKKKLFIDGHLVDPGGKYDPYVSEKLLDPCPSALELITKSTEKKEAAEQDAENQEARTSGDPTVPKVLNPGTPNAEIADLPPGPPGAPPVIG